MNIVFKIGEQVRGISADAARGTYWIYTDQSIYELSTENEATDVWKTYLEKGQYNSALEYTRTAAQRDIVTSAQAQSYFDQGRYFQAAQCYSQSSVPFEDVALKFLDVGERDSLRSYLVSRLERTQKGVSCTWIGLHTLTHGSCGPGSHTTDDAGDVARRILPQQMQRTG